MNLDWDVIIRVAMPLLFFLLLVLKKMQRGRESRRRRREAKRPRPDTPPTRRDYDPIEPS